MTGPFETEREAIAASLWNIRGRQAGTARTANLADLADQISAAAVELGAHDKRIVEWLAGYEPSTVAVICGLISRAHAAGLAKAGVAAALDAGQLATVLDGLADAAEYRRRSAGEQCTDCETSPMEVCQDHLDDLDAADSYAALAGQFGQEAGQ